MECWKERGQKKKRDRKGKEEVGEEEKERTVKNTRMKRKEGSKGNKKERKADGGWVANLILITGL